jgi:hypothetical protein
MKLIDFTWLIAAWVTKKEPTLEPIRDRARQIRRLVGYPSPENPDEVQAQVKALYQALHDHGIKYDNNTLVCHQDANDYVQHVRLPAQTMREKAANCLDGTVLFASLLSASDLHPLILLVPGHALVGWKDRDSEQAEWEFLEVTVIDKVSFEEAHRLGQERYEKEMERFGEKLINSTSKMPELLEAQQFAIPIDVHKVWQELHVMPLPYS